jgi:hypothetical protein
VARMRVKEMHTWPWSENLKERPLEDIGVGASIILKCVAKILDGRVWTGLARIIC